MPENTMAANLLGRRGNRASAVLLSWLEENVYEHIPEDLQRQTRQVVLDNINGFKDLATDIVKSDTAYINQVWVQKLDEIHEAVKRQNGDYRNRSGR